MIIGGLRDYNVDIKVYILYIQSHIENMIFRLYVPI